MKLMALAVVVPLNFMMFFSVLFMVAPFALAFYFLILSPVIAYIIITFVHYERQSARAIVSLLWLALLLRNSGPLLQMIQDKRANLQRKIQAIATKFLESRKEVSILNGIEKRDPTKTLDKGF